VLFQTRIPVNPTADEYALRKDGAFLPLEGTDSGPQSITFIVNWPAALARR
jgi:hypothetical protein